MGCFPHQGKAHPHVFVAQQLTTVFDAKGLAGIQVNWIFDDMFSSMISSDHDRNENGMLEPEEVQSIKANAFSFIKEFDYFSYIRIDSKPFKVKYVTDFSATLDRGRLSYDFFIPCHVSATRHPKEVVVSSYDPSYYSAIYFNDKKPVDTVNGSDMDVNLKVGLDKETSIYYDMVNPWALFFSFRLK